MFQTLNCNIGQGIPSNEAVQFQENLRRDMSVRAREKPVILGEIGYSFLFQPYLDRKVQLQDSSFYFMMLPLL